MAFQPGIQLLLQAHTLIHDSSTQYRSSPPKSSHNELERGRRAHLRGCMDELKSQLNQVTPGTRMTTLFILKAAKEQILDSRLESNHYKRLLLRRQQDFNDANERHRRMVLEMEKLKTQLRRKRRSGSECSVATTLSEESDVLQPTSFHGKRMKMRNVVKCPKFASNEVSTGAGGVGASREIVL